MTLAEKILHLRTAQDLSQGDLAERLEVSRQSVSKWETGQSGPDLDKIIRLADLFGVTVDELVREEVQPERPQLAPEPQVVYVEKQAGLTPAQITGAVLMVLGGLAVILGLVFNVVLVALGLVLFILGFPPLLSKKHPRLIFGWLLTSVSILILTPQLVGFDFTPNPASLLFPFRAAAQILPYAPLGTFSAVILLLRSAILWLLIILTLRAWFKTLKKRD